MKEKGKEKRDVMCDMPKVRRIADGRFSRSGQGWSRLGKESCREALVWGTHLHLLGWRCGGGGGVARAAAAAVLG